MQNDDNILIAIKAVFPLVFKGIFFLLFLVSSFHLDFTKKKKKKSLHEIKKALSIVSVMAITLLNVQGHISVLHKI